MCGCVHVSVGVCARDRFCACLKEGERHKKRTGDRETERERGREADWVFPFVMAC